MRAWLRLLPVLASTLLIPLALACGPARGGGGGDDEGLGDPCSASDEGDQQCDGSFALECKTNEDGDLTWEGRDCRDSGERCERGKCVEADANNANSANNAACPDLAGTWSFEDHCEAVLIGTDYAISQAGCDLTVATVGWTGSVDAGGAVTISGPGIGGNTMTCTGQATDTRLEATCTPTCDVVLVR